MKHIILFITILALAALACGAITTPAPLDIHVVETIAAATLTAMAPTQAPPTLIPVPPLTPLPTFTLAPAATAIPTLTPLAASGPIRIRFAPGGISATVQNTVIFPNRVEYIFSASKSQHMTVTIESTDNNANFLIFGMADHSTLKRFENEDRTWTGVLPTTQDYLISVAVPGRSADFTLTVTIVWP
jgi:hypothetical protein